MIQDGALLAGLGLLALVIVSLAWNWRRKRGREVAYPPFLFSPSAAPFPGVPAERPRPTSDPVRPPPSSTTRDAPEEPFDGTLQLLPGRLEIESGTEDRIREVRFVRVPGAEPEITVGRSAGPPHQHVRLDSPTVSRLHARLRFSEGCWTLRNESATNPTLLNSHPLNGSSQATLLHDGDRIEIGEVVLRFRQAEARDRLPFRSAWYTDRGRRPTNQDAVAVRTLSDGRELAVVCDGMGGHAAGELASHRALDALVTSLEGGAGLDAAVGEANAAVRAAARSDPDRAGMGTTLAALLRAGDRYEIANVGDSRAYRIDADGIRQITVDHSFLAEVAREGGMSLEEAGRSPWRNALTRHLGADDEVAVDLFGPFDAAQSHVVVLCTDGACSALPDPVIEELLRGSPTPQEAAREIGEAALRQGSEDNVSVAIVQFGRGLSELDRRQEPFGSAVASSAHGDIGDG